MLFGPRSAYEDVEKTSVSKGQIVSVSPPFVLPPVNQPARDVGTGIVLKVIPLSSTVGILCRTPSYQTISSVNQTASISGSSSRLFSKVTSDGAGLGANMIHGQIVKMNSGSGTRSSQAGRLITIDGSSDGSYQLSADDFGTGQYSSITRNITAHLCSDTPPTTAFNGYSISSQNTGGGNKLWKVTIASGADLTDGEYWFVSTSISGARSAPLVSKFMFDSHGLPTDGSFSTVGSSLPTQATMQVGNEKTMPTVNDVISEINQSLLTVIKKPLDGSTYSMEKIELTNVPSLTLTDREIAGLRVNESSNGTIGTVEFEPKYLRGSRIRDQVYKSRKSPFANIHGLTKTKRINHCLNVTNSRMDEIADFWARPEINVGFTLFDETYTVDLGDKIEIDHDDFTGIILVTSISPKQIGIAIQGRKV